MVLQHSRLMRCPGWRATSFTGIYCCSFKHQSLKRQGNLPMEKRQQNLINDIEKQVSANTESINDLGVRINKAGQPFARNDEYRVQIDDHILRLDNRLDKIDDRIVRLEEKIEGRFTKTDERFGRGEASIAVIVSNYMTSENLHKEMRAHTAWMLSCMFAIAGLTVVAAKLLFVS